MKVLMVALSRYESNDPDSKLTGANTFITSLIRAEKEHIDVSFLALSNVLKNENSRNVIIRRLSRDFMRVGAFFVKKFPELRKALGYKEAILRICFLGALKDIIDKEKPQIVHFHGASQLVILMGEYCDYLHQEYMFTDHLYLQEKRFETMFCDTRYRWISVVSSGMKKRILCDYPDYPENKIRVILNGTDIKRKEWTENIYKQYGIDTSKKKLLCIGTISERKNQMQIIRAYESLPAEYREDIVIVFLGQDGLGGLLQSEIEKRELQNHVYFPGGVSQETVTAFYSFSDGVISASKAEGFSMVFLEAMVYGLPLILPEGLDANEDIRNDEVTCITENNSDEGFVAAMKFWYDKQWNKDFIRDYSDRFRMEETANNYIQYYEDIVTEQRI